MAQLTLHELLQFLQRDPITYTTPVIFGECDSKIIETIMTFFSAYKEKIFCAKRYLEVSSSSKSITLQKSQEARILFPTLSVGIIENIGLDFKHHSPDVEGWPGNSTVQVVKNFAGNLHLLAELHKTKEVYYYSNYAIRWGKESHQVIFIDSVTKGTLVASIDGEESIETYELISHQFVPEGQDKTLNQMTADEKWLYDPRMKALAKVLIELKNNGLVRDEE